jgi:2-methylcitrate dehydratase PrpD
MNDPPVTEPASSTARLAAFAVSIDPASLPVPVVRQASRLLLDTVGCILGGLATEAGGLATRWAAATGGAGEASVLGTPHRLTPPLGAYANGRLGAVLDADETWPSAGQTAHLAVATVAAALAMTETRDGSGADLIASIVAGYEIGARISDALEPIEETTGALRAGWGPGSQLGATGAAARGLALNASTAVQAIGIAATHADVPPLQWPHERPAPMAKSADAGWHALQAVAAAEMAAFGLTGYPHVLDGDDGLWRALGYCGWDEEELLGGLGVRWKILDAAFKRWPCQYWMHPPLTALAEILERQRPEADAFRRITLETNPKSAGPKFRDQDPPGEIDRAFSLPHAAAMLVLGVTPGPRWLGDETAADPRVARLRSVVGVEVHPDAGRVADRVVGHVFRDLPARAIVELADGTRLVCEARLGLGAPWLDETRLSDDQLEAKAREMAGDRLTADAIAWIRNAASQPHVRDLTRLLSER